MPKITSQKIHRLHISLYESEYKQIQNLAEQNHTSISEIIRTCIKILTNKNPEKITEITETNNSKVSTPLNLEF